jgi:hypothetical protein
MANMVVTKKQRKSRFCSAAKATFLSVVFEVCGADGALAALAGKANLVSDIHVNTLQITRIERLCNKSENSA